MNPATEAASSNDHTSIGNVNVNTSSPDFVLGSPLGPDGSVSMGTLVRKDRANRGSSATSEDIVAKYYGKLIFSFCIIRDRTLTWFLNSRYFGRTHYEPRHQSKRLQKRTYTGHPFLA